MALAFTEKRRPRSVLELTPAECKQLTLAWESYAGEVEGADQLIADNEGWFELWTVTRDGVPAFDYWHLPPDSGSLFYVGEPAPTGIRVIQFGWDVADDLAPRSGIDLKSLADELGEAWRTRREG